MATKKTTTTTTTTETKAKVTAAAEAVAENTEKDTVTDENMAVADEPKPCEGCCKDVTPPAPPDGYVPVKLRSKLEKTAEKILDNLANFSGEYNTNQINQIGVALDIYRTICY